MGDQFDLVQLAALAGCQLDIVETESCTIVYTLRTERTSMRFFLKRELIAYLEAHVLTMVALLDRFAQTG